MRRIHLHVWLALVALALACAPAAATPTPQVAPTAPTVESAPTAVSAPTTLQPAVIESTATAAPPLAQTEPAVAPPPSAPAPTLPATEPTLAAPALAPEFSGLEAARHVTFLAGEIGSRPAGSESQARAAQYVLEQLQALGYQAELQPFPISFYDDRGSSLTVAGALGRSVTTITLVYSPSGSVEGELVDVGLGRVGDFSPAAVQGRVALIRRGEIRFSEKVDNVARAGALAAVIYNNQPGIFTGNLAGPGPIPSVGISAEEGQQLATQVARATVTARVAVDASMEQRAAANVVATRAGGPETIVIGGHFDSVPNSPGANDNASGTAVMLELARVLAARPSPFTLKLVAFDAEEIGLLGSAHMVGQLSEEERRSVRAMINLDMVGVGQQPLLGGSDELTRLGFAISSELGQTSRPLGGGLNGASDHASFLRVGIPAIFLYRSEDPNYHSPNDQVAFVDPANLEFAGRLALGLVEALEAGR